METKPHSADTVWAAIDDQRTRTVALLETLTEAQWEHPSLCENWTVRHVAAHLTLQQQRVRDVAAFMSRNPTLLRSLSLNRSIHDSAVVQAQLPTTDLVVAIGAMIGSRRHNTFVTPLETLTDILVHGQDIAVPLDLDLVMPPSASALAATRRWDTRKGWMSTVFRALPLEGHRFTATDIDWSRGQGPDVVGPIGALLLLLTGRNVALGQLTGSGADDLRATLDKGGEVVR